VTVAATEQDGRNGRTPRERGERGQRRRVHRSLLYLSLYPCRKRPFRPVVPLLVDCAPHQADPRLNERGVGTRLPSTGGILGATNPQPVVVAGDDFDRSGASVTSVVTGRPSKDTPGPLRVVRGTLGGGRGSGNNCSLLFPVFSF
jgi:hypothetical protein